MHDFWSFFAFPLNLMLAILWMLGCGWLRNRRSESTAVRFLLSPTATLSSISLLVAACLYIGLSGDMTFVQSVLFVAILLYVQTVLLMVLLRGWRNKEGVVRWRFTLLHAGLLLALGAGFWGSPDSEEFRIKLHRGEGANVTYRLDGNRTTLSYELTLKDFAIEMDDNGQPSHYEAYITIDEVHTVKISVNQPHSVSIGEDIYLASITADSCVLQIVKEPWRYLALAGILILLIGAFMLFIKGPR